MRTEFFELVRQLGRELGSGETLLCNLHAERSDFVRFNQARVRQAGSVEQRYITVSLLSERRQASATLAIAGNGEDLRLARDALLQLRDALGALPEDPWLLINEEVRSTISERRGTLPAAEDVVETTIRLAEGLDFVGFYAGGTLYRGFANSLGQQNWHEIDTFNFDWSLYRQGDQAVKTSYAGLEWQESAFAAKLKSASEQPALLERSRKEIAPGEYRAYLGPRALEELLGLLSWGAFSARVRATKQSPLLRMEHGEKLAHELTLKENTEEGTAPVFQAEGFVKPAAVTLISRGTLGSPLVSPRSAKEYGLATNAANAGESPASLDLAAGSLEERGVLAALDTGLYIPNLWYLNFSDRPAGRVTGMTRFATFWVEHGRIVAPLTPMRFDDSIYRMLGENLIDLTRERELLLDASTYEERSTSSARLPGALLRGLRFTL